MRGVTRWLVVAAATTLPMAALAQKAAFDDEIARRAAALEPRVITWRRDIHQHPELANRERRTAALVAQHLRELGLEVQTGVAVTGVVGVLRGDPRGPVVALRADMDALPVTENTNLEFASVARGEYEGREVGVMHACGHDNHVAILMGAAEVLASLEQPLPGTVKFIFQPAEEGAPKGEDGGAELMVTEGVLRNPKVDAIFGLHVGQAGPVGSALYRAGGAMASAQRFDVTVHGRQTHAARPWAGVDPIVVGAQFINAVQTIISRQIDITSAPAVVTVGTFRSGVRHNIVPDTATMSGTIRTFDPQARDQISSKLQRIAANVGEAFGAEIEVDIEDGVPVTFNEAALVEQMLPTLNAVYGASNVMISPRITGAEDFSFYQEKVPGFFFFIGGRPASISPENAIPNHSPFFTVDEKLLVPGVRVMSQLAIDYLNGGRLQP